MGIPSYFSYIIRNHPEIITNLEQLLKSHAFQYTSSTASIPIIKNTGFQHLFFDANSIIYDAFHTISAEHRANPIADIDKDTVFFPLLTQRVIETLEKHIHFIQPSETLLIAFDGLPPPAKIVQQKSRRFKTRHLESMLKQLQIIHSPITPTSSVTSQLPTAVLAPTSTPFPWQTTMITPGTPFMYYLSQHLTHHFNERRLQFPQNPPIQILSTSTEAGEGEHKIFQYLRNHPPKSTDRIALYGLDSDLIMLSLLSVPNIYIFREAPAFLASKIDDILQKVTPKHLFSHAQTHTHTNAQSKSQQMVVEEIPPYFLNINLLANAIRQSQMYSPTTPSQPRMTNPVYDYVFMCFLLGNDFLPHIPALNLRTNGLSVLLNHYHQTRAKPLQLIEPTTQQIQWKELWRLLEPIAKEERELLIRDNQAFRKMPKPSLFTEKINTHTTSSSQSSHSQSSHNHPSKRLTPEQELQEFLTAAPQYYTAAREYIRPEIERNWQERYRRVFPTACPLRFLKQMSDTWSYYLGRLVKLEHTTDAPPLLSDIVNVLRDFQPNQIESIAPLQTLEFQTNEEYLEYVLSEVPMKYDFTFSKMLWEVHVH